MDTEKEIQRISQKLKARFGLAPVDFEPVKQGYTEALRFIAVFPDARRVFIKAALNELCCNWLRREQLIYASLNEAYMPQMLAWIDEDEKPILVLEDLSKGDWSGNWSKNKIQAVLAALDSISKTKPPAGLPSLESMRGQFASWTYLATSKSEFLKLDLSSEEWLCQALPHLIEADKRANLAGNKLLHLDIRSDNICFFQVQNKVLLADWNWACTGNPQMDLLLWLPSLHMEGGPAPQLMADAGPDTANLIALISGYWVSRAATPPPHKGSSVRRLQRKQAEVSLNWWSRLKGFSPPNASD